MISVYITLKCQAIGVCGFRPLNYWAPQVLEPVLCIPQTPMRQCTPQAKVKPTTCEMKHIHALTFSLVYFHWKCNLLLVCSSHTDFQRFKADMLKVRRLAVGHSTVNSWRVETIGNQTFQFLLVVLITKGYIPLVNLQKSAF